MNAKAKRSDIRKPEWPEGLSCRNSVYRYRRHVQGTSYVKNIGEVSEEEAVRQARRFNFNIEDGARPFQVETGDPDTVAAFARNVWLPKKKAEIRPASYERYAASSTTSSNTSRTCGGLIRPPSTQ